jgi:anti-anti-sigma regulatory factor
VDALWALSIMTLSQDDPAGVLQVSGALDIESANSLREALLARFISHPEITADLAGVGECDTAALQVLLAARGLRCEALSPAVAATASALGLPIEARNPTVEKSHGR